MDRMEGSLVDPPGEPSCAVCGSEDCVHFREAPYKANYPFLPGGYDPDAPSTVAARPNKGARRGGPKWRS